MKLISNKESYGFLGRLWIKGEIVEIESSVNYPKEHFDVIEGEKHDEEVKEIKPKVKKK